MQAFPLADDKLERIRVAAERRVDASGLFDEGVEGGISFRAKHGCLVEVLVCQGCQFLAMCLASAQSDVSSPAIIDINRRIVGFFVVHLPVSCLQPEFYGFHMLASAEAGCAEIGTRAVVPRAVGAPIDDFVLASRPWVAHLILSRTELRVYFADGEAFALCLLSSEGDLPLLEPHFGGFYCIAEPPFSVLIVFHVVYFTCKDTKNNSKFNDFLLGKSSFRV